MIINVAPQARQRSCSSKRPTAVQSSFSVLLRKRQSRAQSSRAVCKALWVLVIVRADTGVCPYSQEARLLSPLFPFILFAFER